MYSVIKWKRLKENRSGDKNYILCLGTFMGNTNLRNYSEKVE